MKRDDIVQMILSIGNKRFDEIITNVKEYDKELIESYIKRAGINLSLNDSVLYNLGVIDNKGYLNNTGILFFNKNPKKYLINAYITCVRYKGTSKTNVIDRKDFEYDLVSQVESAIEFVKRNTKLSYEIKGLVRKDIPEYPTEAIREAILNAVMHRDYFEKGANVQIDIFDDRLVVSNIGFLIKPLTKKSLGKLSVRRNPLIADLFQRIHFVEKIGSGINKIKEECKKHGNVRFSIEANGFFIATFKLIKKLELSNAMEKSSEKSSEKIINLLKENKEITIEEIAKKLNLTTRAIDKNISKLKQKRLLIRVGSDKGGYWEVRESKKR